jgi:hypothetical protein
MGDQAIIAQEYEDIEFVARKMLEEYEKWVLKINLVETLYTGRGVETRLSVGRSERLH